MIPARLSPIAVAFLLSGIMSFIVTCIATAKALGIVDDFFGIWLSSWLLAWVIAFPTMVVFGPGVRRLVARNSAT